MSMGDAIARGIAKGLGEGVSQHLADQRRERQDALKITRTFDMFKKQQDYRTGMEYIQGQNEVLGKWEEAAKLDTPTLAYRVATKMSEPFAKEDRPKFFREAIKQLNGMSKAELLSRAGYVKPDYSQYVDKPEYQDAIPKARIAGIAELPDAESVFQYDPSQFKQLATEDTGKLTDKQREFNLKVRAGQDMVTSVMRKNGLSGDIPKATVELLVAQVGGNVGYTPDAQGNLVSPFETLLVQKIQHGDLVQDEEGRWVPPEVMQEVEEPKEITGTGYVSPSDVETYKQKQTKEKQEAIDKQVVSLGEAVTKKGYVPVVQSIDNALELLDNASPEMLSYITGLKSLGGNIARDLVAKLGDEGARQAQELVTALSNVRNITLKERSGAAVTNPEMQRFLDELANPSVFNDVSKMKMQLGSLRDTNLREARSKMVGYSDEVKQELARREPEYATLLGIQGTPEGDQETLGSKFIKPEGVDSNKWSQAMKLISERNVSEDDAHKLLGKLFPAYKVASEPEVTSSEAVGAPKALPEDFTQALTTVPKEVQDDIQAALNAGTINEADALIYIEDYKKSIQ